MVTTEAFAPAKINLTLHVTDQRADGYHLLDSLVVFADFGDRVSVGSGDGLQLEVTGPLAQGVPTDESNLVLRAARAAGVSDVHIVLEKHLPAAAGIGGGSSDAAATLWALKRHGAVGDLDPLTLGADVPVCMLARTARMRGIGEQVEPVSGIPPLPTVLVNPGVSVHTPDVFRRLERRDGSPMPDIPRFETVEACANWLKTQRNDLEAPARAIEPAVGRVLSAIDDQRALLTRMSGSGATCFGLFADLDAANQAAEALKRNTSWWVEVVTLGSSAPAQIS